MSTTTKTLITIYSDIDEKIIHLAGKYDLALTGGTALELLCNSKEVPSRKRSDNDLDFISVTRLSDETGFVNELFEMGFVTKSKKGDFLKVFTHSKYPMLTVDILIDNDSETGNHFITVDDKLVLTSAMQFWMKFLRYRNSKDKTRRSTDRSDLGLLLKVVEKRWTVDKFEMFIDSVTVDQAEITEINQLIRSFT